MRKRTAIGIFTVFFIMICFLLSASDSDKVLKVATRQSPPFSFKDSDGQWKGLSIELWKEIANDLNYEYKFYETTLTELLKGLNEKKYDAGVAGITITSDREKILTFSQPFISSSLGIAFMHKDNPWMDVLSKFLSLTFLKIILSLVAILLLAGFGVWFFERRKNDEFSGKPHTGLGSAFWWAAVTMTTVGYGDKSPRTVGGRIIGLIWMFMSVIILTSFTAAFVSSLTIASVEEAVTLTSIKNHSVATIRNSTADKILKNNDIQAKYYNTCEEMLRALEDKKVQYIVYDLPMLRYYGIKYSDDYKIIKLNKYRQDYGIAAQISSPILKQVNIQLLDIIHTANWREIEKTYLGDWSTDFEEH